MDANDDHDDVVLQAALAEEKEQEATEAAAEKAKSEQDKDDKSEGGDKTTDAPEQKDDSQKAESEKDSKANEAESDEAEASQKRAEQAEAAKAEDQPDDAADKAKAEEADKSTETEPPKPTRKERRQERRRSFLESIREGQPPAQQRPRKAYEPVDYNQLPDDQEIPREALAQDRERYGADQFVAGAELERQTQEQKRFWDRLEMSSEKLYSDPKFSYLDETSDDFNEERAGRVNEMFLIAAGYKETPQFDQNGQPVLDANGNQARQITVDRPDLSYEKFVREYQADIDAQVEQAKAEAAKAISKQKSQSGVRPSGTRQSQKKTFTPAEISRMSPEEFEENREDIEAQEREAVEALDL